MIIYFIIIILINILILNIKINIKNNKFYELKNILTQLKNTNIPDIYFTRLDILLINYENNKNNTGKCLCLNNDKKICRGKGEGNGENNCKKMTISIFQSGNIIITGKCNLKQLYESYDFIINICNKHFDEIYQPLLSTDIRKIKRRSVKILERKNFQ